MLLLKIHLKTALDLANGPQIEEIEFESLDEIKYVFRYFPNLKITDHEILKNGVPVGKIYEGDMK